MSIAATVGAADLLSFCKEELAGYGPRTRPVAQDPPWRKYEAYFSPYGELNVDYEGFACNAQLAFEMMRNNPKLFFPRKICMMFPLNHIEKKNVPYTKGSIHRIEFRSGDWIKDAKQPDEIICAYARADAMENVLEAVRAELTRRLLDLIPGGTRGPQSPVPFTPESEVEAPGRGGTMKDPIVEEIHRYRQEHAAKFNYDVDAIARDIQEREKTSKARFVDLSKAPPDPPRGRKEPGK
jgi:hypothetical protein